MHNYIGSENLVALLKYVPLHPNQNWSKYAFWSLCFCADNQVTSNDCRSSTMTAHEVGLLPIGTICWFLCSDSCLDVEVSENLQILQSPMLTNRSFSALEKALSTDKFFPKRTPSEIIESLKSLLFTWWRLLNRNALPESLNCMGDSMQLTPQQLISACPFSDGRSSERPNLEYESTRRLTSLRRFPYSTESPTLRYMMSTPWTGLHTSLSHAMCLIEGTLTLQGSTKSIAREHSLSFERSFILLMR